MKRYLKKAVLSSVSSSVWAVVFVVSTIVLAALEKLDAFGLTDLDK